MLHYEDASLNEMINACKEATRQLRYVKTKEKIRLSDLRNYRRNEMSLIRVRATELGLTQTDLDNIYEYVHNSSD